MEDETNYFGIGVVLSFVLMVFICLMPFGNVMADQAPWLVWIMFTPLLAMIALWMIVKGMPLLRSTLFIYQHHRHSRFMPDHAIIARLERELRIGEIPIHEWDVEAEVEAKLATQAQLVNRVSLISHAYHAALPTAAEASAGLAALAHPSSSPPRSSRYWAGGALVSKAISVMCVDGMHEYCDIEERNGVRCWCPCHTQMKPDLRLNTTLHS